MELPLYQHGPQKRRSLKFGREETNRSPVEEKVYIKIHEQLATIAGAANEDGVTEEKLLTAATFDCEYDNNTITSVTHK